MVIIIQSGSPEFTEPEDLEALAEALNSRAEGEGVIIHQPRDQRGRAVTPWEVVYIWLTTDPNGILVASGLISGAAAGAAGKVSGWVVEAVKDWVKKQHRQAREEHEIRKKENLKVWSIVRPTAVIILGPDGKELLTVEQKGEDDEPREVVNKQYPRQMPPPRE